MAAIDIALLEKTVNRLTAQPGVIGVLVMNAEGVVLRTTLQAEVAVQASALTQGVIKVARTAVRELGLVNFGAPPEDEFAPPSRKEPVEVKPDDLQAVRIRSRDHEYLIAPEFEAGRAFTLVVVHQLPREG